MAKHLSDLNSNVEEVERLQQIHTQLTGTGPGRRHNVAVLHKSAIVLLVACWEAYVEDLVAAALEHMIGTCKDHNAFPPQVLDRIASAYSGPKAWMLAGDGWKTVLRGNMAAVLAKTTGVLNTPKTAQVDDLFHKALGLASVSASWTWRGTSCQKSAKALDDLVTLRGSIAHRVSTAGSVKLQHVNEARELIYRLAARTHNRTVTFLTTQVGTCPWGKAKYGSVS